MSIRHAGGGRDGGPHVAAHRDAFAVGQPDVEDRDIGAKRRDAGHGLRGGAGLADDLDVVLGLEQLRDAPPDDLVVVEQEHGDAHGTDPPRRPSSSRRYCRVRGGRAGRRSRLVGSNGPIGPLISPSTGVLGPVVLDRAALGAGKVQRQAGIAAGHGPDGGIDDGRQQHGSRHGRGGSSRPSAGAREAAGWAADLAAAWGVRLHLVHVMPQGPTVVDVPPWLGELLDATERAGTDPPRAEILRGAVVDALADRAVRARMLVLGSYGEGARSGMLAGSVASASSTVFFFFARRPSHRPGRGRTWAGPGDVAAPQRSGRRGGGWFPAAGRAALQFGAGLAASLSTRLAVVHTWADVVVGIDGGAHRRPEVRAFLEAEGAALLKAELDWVEASYPGLPVERDLVGNTPVRALMDRARSARLLVVGHRGHDSGPGMLAGSTSRALVEFAPCPVVVTRPAALPDERAHIAGSAGAAR